MSAGRKILFNLMKDVALPAAMAGSDLASRIRHRKRKAPPPWAGPPLRCSARLKQIMMRHYGLARFAKGARPVAWVTSGFPVELARAFDFYTVYPENHGAVCGARKVGPQMSAPAEAAGFSQDLCSYARIDLGVALGAKGPAGTLPRPDVLLCSNNICQTVLYWYRQLAWMYDVPLLLFDTPFVADDLSDASVDYMASQLKDFIPHLERISRRPFDPDRFTKILLRARDTSLLWGQCLQTMAARPAPMSIFDAFVHMAPVVSLRGLPVAEQYYEVLLEELSQRVKDGVGAIRPERHRLLWDNIAVWFKVADFARIFGSAGLAFVAATYTSAWAETTHFLDPSKPFHSVARAYALVVLNRNLDHRVRLMKRMVQDFSIDGALFHSTRSCKPYSVGQYDIRTILQAAGVKTLIVEADTTDPRWYAEEAVRTRIDAFIETLG
jgi:benzoyl-CoA reductase/2-hydroxyglutaryl-CoA dehydratase subunit BcrC/BadD/HgdB